MLKKLLALLVMLVLDASVFLSESPWLSEFDVQRYLGQWYEIARLDHSFERGLGKSVRGLQSEK
ncbi:MAG: lipocalin family protein [Desulfobacterales bacterium]